MATMPGNLRELLDRVKARLLDLPLIEKAMFGMVAIMLDGEMVAAVHKDGSILVRVSKEADAELMARPGTSRLKMGDRPMGTGWILVDETVAADDEQLDFWIARALDRRAR